MAAKTKKTSTAKKTTTAPAPALPTTTVAPVVKPVAPAAKPVAPAAPVAKSVATPASATKTANAAERAKMIEVAAYVLAEKNGFRGDAKAYWLQAEKDVDVKLGKK